MATANLLQAVTSRAVLYAGVGPVTVAELMSAKYGATPEIARAISIVAHSGAGQVVLTDIFEHDTFAITLDATGATGRREQVFQYRRIVSITNGLQVEVYT